MEAAKVLAINRVDAAVERIVTRISVQLYAIPERELRGVVRDSRQGARRIRGRLLAVLGDSLMRTVRDEVTKNERG